LPSTEEKGITTTAKKGEKGKGNAIKAPSWRTTPGLEGPLGPQRKEGEKKGEGKIWSGQEIAVKESGSGKERQNLSGGLSFLQGERGGEGGQEGQNCRRRGGGEGENLTALKFLPCQRGGRTKT